MGLLGRQNGGSAEQTAKQRLLVVGNGMVVTTSSNWLVAAGGLEQFDVTVLAPSLTPPTTGCTLRGIRRQGTPGPAHGGSRLV